ncbi:PIG-X [Cunninghamella echinulata]|nr:PIG-X [Cunninghamella echinulata]
MHKSYDNNKIEFVTIPLSPPSPYTIATCALDIVYTLPPSLFVDRYQLRDLYHDIDFLIDDGDADLEAPLELVPSDQASTIIIRNQVTTELMTHLRYQRPDLEQTHRIIDVPLPKVGWLCQNVHKSSSPSPLSPTLSPPTLKEALSFYLNNYPHPNNNNNNNQNNNNDWTWLPILSSSNMDHHQQDPTSSSSLQIQLPVGNLNDVMIVQWGTIVSIILGTLWILWSVAAAVKKHRRHEAKGKRRKSE